MILSQSYMSWFVYLKCSKRQCSCLEEHAFCQTFGGYKGTITIKQSNSNRW